MISYGDRLIADRERKENKATAREIEFDRLRAEYLVDCDPYWTESADKAAAGNLSSALFGAQTPEVAWYALNRWRDAAADRYANRYVDLAHVDGREPEEA